MALALASASSQYIYRNESFLPSTGSPICWSGWLWLTAVGTVIRDPVSFCDSGITNDTGIYVRMQTSEIVGPMRLVTGSGVGANGVTLLAAVWAFVICRFLADNNCWAHAWDGRTAFASNQGTLSVSPTSLDRVIYGCQMGNGSGSGAANNFWNGRIAETTWYNGDIYHDSASAMPNWMIMQLATQGPFSMPYTAARVREYRSWRSGIIGAEGKDAYYQFGDPGPWTLSGSPTIGAHPPLPDSYVPPPWARRRGVFVPV